jgi:hypothetical protein
MPTQIGTKTLFWHYPNQYMWTGNGNRQYVDFIVFDQPFNGTPKVIAAISGLDGSNQANLRVNVRVDWTTPWFFRVVCDTWADTKLAMVSIAWTAVL